MNKSVKTVMVTGALGVLGRSLVRQLLRAGGTKLIIPLRQPQLHVQEFNHPDIQVVAFHSGDAQQIRSLMQSIAPSVVIHAAATGLRAPKPDFTEMAAVNVELSLRLLEATRTLEACHFIFVSSGLAYQPQERALRESDPLGTLHPYGATKAVADILLRAAATAYHRRLTVVRPFAFTGEHDGSKRLFPSLLRCAIAGKPFIMTSGQQIRDFSSVDDIARGIVSMLHMGDGNEVFNLGSGVGVTVAELVRTVCSELGLEVELILGEKPMDPFEPYHLVADIHHAQSVLGWSPSIGVAQAVWQLARTDFPELRLCEPMHK